MTEQTKHDRIEELERQLTASQAREEAYRAEVVKMSAELTDCEKQLALVREALKKVIGHVGLYNIFSCEGGDSYDPECADLNLNKIRPIAQKALASIDDAKLLEDLVLCDADPIAWRSKTSHGWYAYSSSKLDDEQEPVYSRRATCSSPAKN